MRFIIQKTVPIIVNTEKFEGDLSEHICLKENPEMFEIVEGALPKEYTTLNYLSKEDIAKEEESK